MYPATVYNIMIGAPSDIQEEIQIVQNIIYEWNHIHSFTQKIIFLPLHWSTDSHPDIGAAPQNIINSQITNKSDLLICIFGTRIGTPTSHYNSGTIEEINKHIEAGKPVMIYFKTVINTTQIDFEQLRKLNDFKKQIQGKALYGEYATVEQFRNTLNTNFQKAVNEHFIADNYILYNPLRIDIPSIKLSEEEIEILKDWINSNNSISYSIRFIGGRGVYVIGNKQYNYSNVRESTKWEDFFEKLEKMDFVSRSSDNKGHPKYKLKKVAFDYIDSL